LPVLENKKHEKFAQEIAKGQSAGNAYAKAGYKPNPKNADRLKNIEVVAARIEELATKGAEKAGVTVERIMAELARIGFADITKAVEWGEAMAIQSMNGDGEPTGEPLIVQGVAMISSANLPPEVTAAISEVRKTKEGISIKFHDKTAALLNMGKQLGMFKEKVEHSGSVNVMIDGNDAKLL
jgi:phage terminase small subunit